MLIRVFEKEQVENRQERTIASVKSYVANTLCSKPDNTKVTVTWDSFNGCFRVFFHVPCPVDFISYAEAYGYARRQNLQDYYFELVSE